MTNEELIREFGYNYNGDSIKLEAELLRRLNERDELEKKLQHTDNELCLSNTILDAINRILEGESVSDFEESFCPVREIADLKSRCDFSEKKLASVQRAVEDLNKIKILVDSGSINTGDDMKDEGYLLAISDVRDIIYLTRKERERK